MPQTTIRLDAKDNIVIACQDLPVGTALENSPYCTLLPIPRGHKIAATPIPAGTPILKYATPIGTAKRDIAPGEHVHDQEILFAPRTAQNTYCTDYQPLTLVPSSQRPTFMGYPRADGRGGTRNLIAVIALSNCAATVARQIVNTYQNSALDAYANVDGVVALTHSLGCGMEKTGSVPMTYLRRVLIGSMKNPNIAGVLLVSVGCERNHMADFISDPAFPHTVAIKQLVIQDVGGSRRAIAQGKAQVEALLAHANQTKRQPMSIEHLSIALQCGGSDSFSSFTANPLVGKTMDCLILNGGTACLSETTEVFSAEESLLRRARTPEVAQKLVDSLTWWLQYAHGKEIQINGQVTPGNMAGGLSNILEKALGSVKKGGSTPLNDCYGYAEQITSTGLVFMDAPSYDPVGATAQFAGGCNLCIFTTGRGSCYGSAYLPTIKVASTSDLFNRMDDDMDVNAGTVLDGDTTLEQLSQVLLEEIIEIASGKQTKSELWGMGEAEFVPWTIGVTG